MRTEGKKIVFGIEGGGKKKGWGEKKVLRPPRTVKGWGAAEREKTKIPK